MLQETKYFFYRNSKIKNCWEKVQLWRKRKSIGQKRSRDEESRFIELTPSEILAEEKNDEAKTENKLSTLQPSQTTR